MDHIVAILKSTLGQQLYDIALSCSLFRKAPTNQKSRQSLNPRAEATKISLPHHIRGIQWNSQVELQSQKNHTSRAQGQNKSRRLEPEGLIKKLTLLELPVDVLFLISDELDIPSVHILALTCRSLYGVGFPKTQRKLEDEDKKQLLIFLEGDNFGRGNYYCHKCNKLHFHEQSWGPQCTEEKRSQRTSSICGMRNRFSPTGNCYGLTYYHARLAMNNHLYGPKHGVPLKNLCIEHNSPRDKTNIHCSTSANIIQDELFLHRTYRFTVATKDAEDFRKCTGARDFRLCEHLPLLPSSSIYKQYVPELQRRPNSVGSSEEFMPCDNKPGSCGLCLMDYELTIERINDGDAWKVTISAYHQLGDCRDPDDWKWARFTEKSRPHFFLPNRPNRRGSGYSPGSVKKMWTEGVIKSIVDGSIF